MKTWNDRFYGVILRRGRELHANKAIDEVRCEGSGRFDAFVAGSELYRISATIENGSITRLSCNCPFATREQVNCKHMAALLLYLEEYAQPILDEDVEQLEKNVRGMNMKEVELTLALAIALDSSECTALLLDEKGKRYLDSLEKDEFELPDLWEDTSPHAGIGRQGDNDPMKILFPDGVPKEIAKLF